MNYIDYIGFFGVSLILLAYFLNLNDKIETTDLRYILMNLIGAVMACIASLLMAYYPFVLLEGVWSIVSLIALANYFRNKRST